MLEEHINLQGISLNIMDTAGIRKTRDVVEKIGVDKAKEFADKADLIMYVIDASAPLDENDYEIFQLIQGKETIILLNKTDLDMIVTKEDVKKAYFASIPSNIGDCQSGENLPIIEVSAKKSNGIEELEETIKNMFFCRKSFI